MKNVALSGVRSHRTTSKSRARALSSTQNLLNTIPFWWKRLARVDTWCAAGQIFGRKWLQRFANHHIMFDRSMETWWIALVVLGVHKMMTVSTRNLSTDVGKNGAKSVHFLRCAKLAQQEIIQEFACGTRCHKHTPKALALGHFASKSGLFSAVLLHVNYCPKSTSI